MREEEGARMQAGTHAGARVWPHRVLVLASSSSPPTGPCEQAGATCNARGALATPPALIKRTRVACTHAGLRGTQAVAGGGGPNKQLAQGLRQSSR